MCGGTAGDIVTGAKKGVTEAKYKADERARQYKREKVDRQTRAAQRNIGEVSSDAMSSFEMGMEGVQDFVEKNTMSLRPSSTDDDSTISDTVSYNYSKSSSEKSSKTDKKGKKESKEGTGGSKKQFYSSKSTA